METYQTTCSIVSLANGGSRIGAMQSVTPNAFSPQRWERLIEDGAIVEIAPSLESIDFPFDNLTIIRGIDNERQNELTALDIRTFEQLATADTSELERDMEVSKRTINAWKKQARTLADA